MLSCTIPSKPFTATPHETVGDSAKKKAFYDKAVAELTLLQIEEQRAKVTEQSTNLPTAAEFDLIKDKVNKG